MVADWFILTDNLNAKHSLWHSHYATAVGSSLYKYVQHVDYKIVAQDTPTFFLTNHGHRPDVFNIALIKLPHLLTEV